MLDFMKISTRETKGGIEVYPKFVIRSSDDLMIRGSDFYAIWDEEKKLWSTNEVDALEMIDKEIRKEVDRINEKRVEGEKKAYGAWMWDSDNKMIDRFHHLVKKQLRDNSHPLDAKLIFSNMETTKKDYASKKLPYPLEACPTPAWDELIGTLYFPTERHKIEWAIGAIVSGESKDIQKFLVMYGPPGSGKSTIINIIQDLFTGYWQPFDSKVLGSANAAFALEAFLSNPLVAIQHDGNLSRIEDNTRLNSLISHETMVMNEKFRTSYSIRFNSFLIMATNAPVKITDSKSGLIRRLIDVSPSGKKIKRSRYDDLMNTVKFELGGIASKCLDIFNEDPRCYDDYIPTTMIGASNDFYNFILDSYDIFKRDNKTTLKAAYEMYKVYCDEARVPYPYPMRIFKEELKSYFKKYEERSDEVSATGQTVMNLYSGFIADKFVTLDSKEKVEKPREKKSDSWIKFGASLSLLDVMLADCFAQYANSKGTPKVKWSEVESKVKDIDTRKLHYILMNDPHHIVIDFDLKNENGEKDLKLNIEAASKWPKTYCELSQGGQGLHLHYIYTGNPEDLSRVYDDNIEIKVFTGNSSLRRRLSDCNDIPVAKISSGLPLKEENKKVIDFEGFKNEKAIRTYIKRNMLKEYVPSTKQSISFIFDALNKMYESGIEYDVSDMAQQVITFAGRSSNNAAYCLGLCDKMKWKSETLSENFEKYDSDTIVFFDVEVFPNLFVVVYKAQGKNPVQLINPTPADISELMKFKLVGFNCKKFDNHIIHARLLGESNYQLFKRSSALVSDEDSESKPYIAAAYNDSYTDIWDFAVNKQGLKKWEIALGIHHEELGLPWDQDVPEELWPKVAEYCTYDVLATEAVFEHLKDEFIAREILAAISGGTVNDSTNKLSAKFIFGNNRKPQSHFRYRNLAEPIFDIPDDMREFLTTNFPEMMAEPHGKAKSILPYFPGYKFDITKPKRERSTYKGYTVGEGGFVMAVPGMYEDTWSLDSASHHPVSVSTEYLLGDYTPRFYDILKARIAIKHKDFDTAKRMFDGKMEPFLGPNSDIKSLSTALKRVVNAAYGLTAQEEKDNYISSFRDPRNVDNIVAKRGALFMIDLLEAITKQGGFVAHCKTDSQKLVAPSKELIEFVFKFAKRYGYSFEVEHHFEKICLVNDAVYIAKLAEDDEEWIGACKKAEAKNKPIPTRWTATGTQFQVPYVFKTLFSKEQIIFDDCCETKSVTGKSDIYLDLNEGLPENEHNYIFVGKVGQFTPVKDGNGGGILVRTKELPDGTVKYDSVNGSKGYRWLESESIRSMKLDNPRNIVDESYYISKVDDAVKTISKFGDIEWFCS